MKIGDLLILDETVELDYSDWEHVGYIGDNWKEILKSLNGVFKVIEISPIFPEHVMLQDGFYYPKKLFKQYSNTYELW